VAELLTVENLIALLTLSSLEIVLGIDNLVLLAVVSSRLEPAVQSRARRIGLVLAMGMRLLLLLAIGWVMGLTAPLFAVLGQEVSGREIILLLGGLFLIGKATFEIHSNMEGAHAHGEGPVVPASFGAAIAQIVALDIVFSLDSVITAVGMVDHIAIMMIAVVLAVIVMMIFADRVSHFIERHPTIKMLALAFMLLIGVLLVAEGLGRHIERGYVYFAMAFSLFVEILNMRSSRRFSEVSHRAETPE
jgi:predicted tellurium resistance membrane protein TerC